MTESPTALRAEDDIIFCPVCEADHMVREAYYIMTATLAVYNCRYCGCNWEERS